MWNLKKIYDMAAAAALFLCSVGPAFAGGGGADAGSVQGFLNEVCAVVGQVPCPQLPTVSQGILEIAGLINARPEAIRYDQNVPGNSVYAGNTLAQSPAAVASLTPLAFIAAHSPPGQAQPTQLYDAKANSFFYAVTTLGTVSGAQQPQTLNLFFDYFLRTTPVFIKGQIVAKISLPLVVLKTGGTEYQVCGAAGCPTNIATLIVKATCTGSGSACLAGEVTGDFRGDGTQQTLKAADLGIVFTATFGASAISTLPHASFAIQLPLVVTNTNDAPYFLPSPITGTATFVADQTGAAVPGLGSVGVPPYAAPQCVGTACPAGIQPTFAICASFSNNFTGPTTKVAPAVAAYIQVATDGETLASAPLPPVTSPVPVCPF